MNKPNPKDQDQRNQEQTEKTAHWTRETRVLSEQELARFTVPIAITPGQDKNPENAEAILTFGGYHLLAEIARGGMGVVFKAYQAHLNRIVAVKMILGGRLASHEQVQRFLIEAEAAANLSHPGIVPVYEFGEHEGTHYFSMAYIDGPSLAGQAGEQPLEFEEAAMLLKKVAAAIAYAHEHGVVHRDLKPANILLDRNDEPRITDFGLAKRTGEDSELTETGAIMGSVFYMSPEQASGESDCVGPGADIYAIGAILYKLLTGRPPFQAASALETIRQVMSLEPVTPRRLNPRIPRDLETICLKCLEKKPDRRYGSAVELGDELDRFLRGQPIQARSIMPWARAWRWCRRNPLPSGLAAGLAIAVLVGIISATTLWNRAQAERQREQARQQTVQVLSKLVLKKTLDETEDWLQLFFEPIEQNLLVARSWGNAGLLDLGRSEYLNQLMVPLVEHYQQASAMMVADDRGREQMVLRLASSSRDGVSVHTWKCRLMRRDVWGDRVQWIQWSDGQLKPTTSQAELPSYDPRTRPWYLGAMGQQSATGPPSSSRRVETAVVNWTDPYPFFTTEDPGITASISFRPELGPDHVAAFDVSLEDISKFTSQKRPTARGSVLVLTGAGDLIGLPHAQQLDGAEPRDAALLKPPSELGIPVVTAATALFSFSDPTSSENGEPREIFLDNELSQIQQFMIEGKRWWAGVRPYRLGVDRALWIIVIVPESDLQKGTSNGDSRAQPR